MYSRWLKVRHARQSPRRSGRAWRQVARAPKSSAMLHSARRSYGKSERRLVFRPTNATSARARTAPGSPDLVTAPPPIRRPVRRLRARRLAVRPRRRSRASGSSGSGRTCGGGSRGPPHADGHAAHAPVDSVEFAVAALPGVHDDRAVGPEPVPSAAVFADRGRHLGCDRAHYAAVAGVVLGRIEAGHDTTSAMSSAGTPSTTASHATPSRTGRCRTGPRSWRYSETGGASWR